MRLDYDELEGWSTFEHLVAAYFKLMREYRENNIIDVVVQQSGVGTDGGRDILLTFLVHDSVTSFERKWVVQCKFYKNAVRKSDLVDVNIPTLIHEYGADGYLLICRSDVTSQVSDAFEKLNKTCKFKYCYMIWNGDDFKQKLLFQEKLIETYFPEFYRVSKNQENK